ncbi:MAG: hypothetical protein POELPBGB_01350 [Bacteroidia bacterium]|nr:hypothetical protein [Bacteroidia bacterium]
MGQYLHCFDLSDRLKCFNFCSRKVIESLLVTQLITEDKKPNPRNEEIENLINCRPIDINGLSSPRMGLIYNASIYRKLTRRLTQQEEKVIKKADLEIAFEKHRRDINYGAPSRLSCIYLADNDWDGKIVLRNMFVDNFRNPLVVEVDILNEMELVKCDCRWLDAYYNDPHDEYIVNYWTEKLYGDQPAWEYLLEGTAMLTETEQAKYIESHVAKKFPTYYEQILIDRG